MGAVQHVTVFESTGCSSSSRGSSSGSEPRRGVPFGPSESSLSDRSGGFGASSAGVLCQLGHLLQQFGYLVLKRGDQTVPLGQFGLKLFDSASAGVTAHTSTNQLSDTTSRPSTKSIFEAQFSRGLGRRGWWRRRRFMLPSSMPSRISVRVAGSRVTWVCPSSIAGSWKVPRDKRKK